MPDERLKALQVELSVDPNRVAELIQEVVEDVEGQREVDTRDIPFVMGLLHGVMSTLGMQYSVHETDQDDIADDDRGRYGAYRVFFHVPQRGSYQVDVYVAHRLDVRATKRT